MRALGQPWSSRVFLWLPCILFAVIAFTELHLTGSLKDWEIFRTAADSVVHGRSPFPARDHRRRWRTATSTCTRPSPRCRSRHSHLAPSSSGKPLFLLGARARQRAARSRPARRPRLALLRSALDRPVVDSLSLGAISSMLLLGVALAWRYRDRAYVAGAATAVTAVAKVFVWPLFVWLLATRRFRAALVAAVASVLLVVGGWAVIGFAGLGGYPHLLQVLTKVDAVKSYSLAGLLRVDGGAATALSGLLVIAVIGGIFLAARGEDGDRRALVIAVRRWRRFSPRRRRRLHYLDLLFVPIRARPPAVVRDLVRALVFWITPLAHSGGSVWRICLVLAVSAYVVWRTVDPAPSVAAAPRSGRAESPHALPSS